MSVVSFAHNASGPYRIVSQPNGLYIVGHGICYQITCTADADALIENLARAKEADEFFRLAGD